MLDRSGGPYMRKLLAAVIALNLSFSYAFADEEKPKPCPTDKEAEIAYAKWLATELPKAGKPLGLVIQIWDGIQLHKDKKKNFIELLRKIRILYAKGGSDDVATIDVCEALADLFGFPLTGANLIQCQDGLKSVPKLNDDKLRKAIDEAIEHVKKDP
jgi:hypothetical protein